MPEKYVLFIFHRDLRVYDHRPLQHACDRAKDIDGIVVPIFIFTPEQISSKAPIRSLMSCACLFQSLNELDDELRTKMNSRLFCFYGKNKEILENIRSKVVSQDGVIDSVFETKDYTPYAKTREGVYREWCSKNSVSFNSIDDLYLLAPGSLRTGSGKVYQKFTPFYEKAVRMDIVDVLGRVKDHSRFLEGRRFQSADGYITMADMYDLVFKKYIGTDVMRNIENRQYKGGRSEAVVLLKNIPHDYEKIHDILAEKTSGLSVHHHYGTISIRESYHRAKELIRGGANGLHAFIRQLFWRDFYGHIMAFFEELYGVDAVSFQKDTPRGELSGEKKKIFRNWCNGETGVPLVDAAMRQLNTSGFMHNRARLVVASWLVKDMGIHWRLGERYFAEKLVDYDFTQNMCNWIWVASKLPFASAPFRRISAERTAEKLDPDNEYIHKWLGDGDED
jgi:deoxyribodipyrimidine photo-lyase